MAPNRGNSSTAGTIRTFCPPEKECHSLNGHDGKIQVLLSFFGADVIRNRAKIIDAVDKALKRAPVSDALMYAAIDAANQAVLGVKPINANQGASIAVAYQVAGSPTKVRSITFGRCYPFLITKGVARRIDVRADGTGFLGGYGFRANRLKVSEVEIDENVGDYVVLAPTPHVSEIVADSSSESIWGSAQKTINRRATSIKKVVRAISAVLALAILLFVGIWGITQLPEQDSAIMESIRLTVIAIVFTPTPTETPIPTETSTPTKTSTPTEIPTGTPSPEPLRAVIAATAMPATPVPPPTPTRTPVPATPTPISVDTPAPIQPPVSTLPQDQEGIQVLADDTRSKKIILEISSPQDEFSGSDIPFAWEASGSLEDGQVFEIVIWKRTETVPDWKDVNLVRGIRRIDPRTANTSGKVNLDKLREGAGYRNFLEPGQAYAWTVLVIIPDSSDTGEDEYRRVNVVDLDGYDGKYPTFKYKSRNNGNDKCNLNNPSCP